MNSLLSQEMARAHIESRLQRPERSGIRRSARLISLEIRSSRRHGR
jgi:hypothetical protein